LQALGGDVCLLLCGTWLQARAWPLTNAHPGAAGRGRPWQREVVTPLRALRRQWREHAQADPQLACCANR
jgi:uncharacterized protein (TIGR02444 family)